MAFKVIIIGAGLSGCLLANGLVNNGVKVTVYERDPANSKREGYQIRLGDAAIAGFRMCLKEEHTAQILAKFGKTAESGSTAPSIYTSQNKLLLDLSKIPSYAKSSAINRVVLRDILEQPLIDCGNAVFGKTFSRYEIVVGGKGSERVRVHFADGTSDTCDLLVGADGSASKVNEQVGLRNLVQITTHWSFLTKGKLPMGRIKDLPSHLLKGPMLVFSKGSSMYYALYLPAKQDQSSDSKSTLDYDEEAASFYWGLHIPKANIPYQEISEIPDRRQLCLDYIKDWAPEFHRMISLGESDDDAEDLYASRLRASNKPSKSWRADCQDRSNEQGHSRIWLIGDAIHAMQPTRGMGGNQALLDCTDMLPELLRLSGQVDAGQQVPDEEFEIACDRYESKMLARSFEWVQKSGGSSMLSINLDGFLGYLLYFIGIVVLPVWSLYYKVAAYLPRIIGRA